MRVSLRLIAEAVEEREIADFCFVLFCLKPDEVVSGRCRASSCAWARFGHVCYEKICDDCTIRLCYGACFLGLLDACGVVSKLEIERVRGSVSSLLSIVSVLALGC